MVDNYRWFTHEMRALPAVVRGRKILACSRLSVAGDELKTWGEREKKRGRTKARNGERACENFYNDLLLV